MWILVAALPIGLLAGLVAGGDLTALRDLRVRLWPVLLPALTFALVISIDSDPPFERFLLPLTLIAFAVVALSNLHLVGMAVVSVGIVANLAPVLLNGDMPVRESAVIGAGIATPETVQFVELGAGRRFEEPADLLAPLGAIVPVDVLNEVLTFGDLIVLLGLVNVGFRTVRPVGRTITAGQSTLATQPIIDLRDQLDLGSADELPAFVQSKPAPQSAARPQPAPAPPATAAPANTAPARPLPSSVEGSASWDL